MEVFFVLKASIFCKMNESVFEDEPSPDWKGAEGVKKLQFFMDERCFWTILFCEGNGLQLFYGVALTTKP